MGWLVGLLVLGLIVWWLAKGPKLPAPANDLSMLPERFVVFDLETTGLDPTKHEIIEIGAILVSRDSDEHLTFQTLVTPKRRVPKRITALTGITPEMVAADGTPLDEALTAFREFVGDLPLVAFNAAFDDSFLRAACASIESEQFQNEVCCALKLARRAWPDRKSFRLADLARDGNLSAANTHRALGDCRRAMIVYAAAASKVGTYR